MSPWSIITDAATRLKAGKYVVLLAAIVAVLALVKSYDLSWKAGLIGTIGCIGLLFVLVLFARLAESPAAQTRPAISTLMWLCIILFAVWSVGLTSAVFFRQPPALAELLFGKVDDIKADKSQEDPRRSDTGPTGAAGVSGAVGATGTSPAVPPAPTGPTGSPGPTGQLTATGPVAPPLNRPAPTGPIGPTRLSPAPTGATGATAPLDPALAALVKAVNETVTTSDLERQYRITSAEPPRYDGKAYFLYFTTDQNPTSHDEIKYRYRVQDAAIKALKTLDEFKSLRSGNVVVGRTFLNGK